MLSNIANNTDNKINFIREHLVFDRTVFKISANPSYSTNSLLLFVKNIQLKENYTVILSDSDIFIEMNSLFSNFKILEHVEEQWVIVKNRFMFLNAFLTRCKEKLSFNNESHDELTYFFVNTKFYLSLDKRNGKIQVKPKLVVRFKEKNYEGSDLVIINSIIQDIVASLDLKSHYQKSL